MKPDEVCDKYATGEVKLTIKDMEDFVLIEGSRDALTFLGELILAQVDANDSGFQISPFGAGRMLFSVESNRGIYLHRIE